MLSLKLQANTRMRTVASALMMTAVIGSATAFAQSPLHRQPNAHEKQKLIEKIAEDGLNCPVLGTVDNAGEDARGKMIRIHCKSLSGSVTWDIRGIAAPHAAALHFESW
jgi:hypothetical protein